MAWKRAPQMSNNDILNNNPMRIEDLFDQPDFMVELHSCNPALNQYLRRNSDLVRQSLDFVLKVPKEEDSHSRVHKYPMMAVEMLEADNPVVMDLVLGTSESNGEYVGRLFRRFQEEEQILPLLAGYMARIVRRMLKTRPNQTLQFVYSHPQTLKDILNHCYSKSVSTILQSLVGIPSTPTRNAENRVAMKAEIIELCINRIEERMKDQEVVGNYCDLLAEVVERWSQLEDGQRMLQLITAEQPIRLFFKIMHYECVSRLLRLIISLYSQDSLTQPLDKRPLLQAISANIHYTMKHTFSLSMYMMAEVICQSVDLNSEAILNSLRYTEYFKWLLEMFFLTQSNIFHRLVEKTISKILVSSHPIHQRYVEHLFCQTDLLVMTVGRIEDIKFGELFSKGYAGYLIKIIRMFSRVKTDNPRVAEVIQQNQNSWMKVLNGHLKMYDQISKQSLGTFDIEETGKVVEYNVSRTPATSSDGGKENTMSGENRKRLTGYKEVEETLVSSQEIEVIPTQVKSNLQEEFPLEPLESSQLNKPSYKKQLTISVVESSSPKKEETGHPKSFDEFMKRASRQAEETIKLRRSSVQKYERQLTPANRNLSFSSVHNSSSQPYFTKTPFITAPPLAKPLLSPRVSLPRLLVDPPVSSSLPPTPQNKNIRVKVATQLSSESQSRRFRSVQDHDLPLLSFLGIQLNK